MRLAGVGDSVGDVEFCEMRGEVVASSGICEEGSSVSVVVVILTTSMKYVCVSMYI